MKKSDLRNIETLYTEYNDLLFNGVLPPANKVNFILHSIIGAIGYSKYSRKPTKNGNHHTIAFCKWYNMSEKLISETLIHEMIHLWQVSTVKQERYEICTHEIAHDRVFRGKMATINLLLKKNCYDLTISLEYSGNLESDMDVKPSEAFTVVFVEYNGNTWCDKVCTKDKEKYIEDLLNGMPGNVYEIETTDPIFNKMKPKHSYDGNLYSTLIDDVDTYEQFSGTCRTVREEESA